MMRRKGGAAFLFLALAVILVVGCNATPDESAGVADSDPSALCPEHLAAGVDLGIEPIPIQFQDGYGQTLVVTDTIEGRDGRDHLVAIEWLHFEDGRRSATEVGR